MQEIRRYILLWIGLVAPLVVAEPVLTIQIAPKESKVSLSDLLKRAQKITVAKDPVYGERRHYLAVSMADLLKEYSVDSTSMIEMVASDGFASVFAVDRLRAYPHAKAYLAIESPKDPWPRLEKKEGSAGPFFLVWVESEESEIRPEEWPYKVERIRLISDLEKLYPKIHPAGAFSAEHPVQKGFKVFLQNCFVCHTMNKQGASQMGPDLNQPYSPVEYFEERFLWKIVRNPSSLRHWPKSQMSSFPESILSDNELKDLVAYLKHMSRNKQ